MRNNRSKIKNHPEVPIKVNAWVDAGIASLVEALNQFESLWTTSSCEGQNAFAHVHFAYNGPSTRFSDFMERLSTELGERLPTDNNYRLTLEWAAGGKKPLGTITAPREVVPSLSKAIRQIAASSVQKSPSQRGTHGTRLRNLIVRRYRRRSAL